MIADKIHEDGLVISKKEIERVNHIAKMEQWFMDMFYHLWLDHKVTWKDDEGILNCILISIPNKSTVTDRESYFYGCDLG